MSLHARQTAAHPGHRTTPQLAAFLGKSSVTIERWLAAGKLGQPAARSPLGWALWSPEQCDRILQWVRTPGLHGPPGEETT